MKRLGEIEWVALEGDLAGFEVGIEHIGPGTFLRWMRSIDGLRYRELPRIKKLREGLEDMREVVPQLWPESFDKIAIVSEEGREEEAEIARKALRECVRRIRLNGVDAICGDACVDEIERWGLRDLIFVRAIEAQQLSAPDSLASRDRAPPVGGPSSDSDRTGGGG